MEHHHGHLFFSIVVIFILFSLTLLTPSTNENLITGQVTQENSLSCKKIDLEYNNTRPIRTAYGLLCTDKNGEESITITRDVIERTPINKSKNVYVETRNRSISHTR